MPETDKHKIIYISSIGHSGSTVLDLILGVIPSAFGVGELMKLNVACDENRETDTGDNLSDSEFWADFCVQISEYTDNDHASNLGGFINNKFYKWMRYDNKKLYGNIINRANKLENRPINTIIDSSKSPLRMTYVNEDERLDVKNIFLIRSPWGVAYSHTKNNRSLLLACWRWVRTNLFISLYLFLRVGSKNKIRVFYEDLCSDTKYELQKITGKFGINKVPNNFIEEINKQTSHRFSGNGLRHKEIKEIKYDDRWKLGLSIGQKLIVGLLCGPLHLLFRLVHQIKN